MTTSKFKAKKARHKRLCLKAEGRKLKAKQQRAQSAKSESAECNSVAADVINDKQLPKKGKAKAKLAKNKGNEAKIKFTNIIAEHVQNHKLHEADRIILRYMLGYGQLANNMWASDVELRRMAGVMLGDLLVKLKRANPGLYFYFWTFINDRGNTSDRQPVIDLKTMHSLVDQVFRKLKLSSFSVDELQGIGNYPRHGKGRTLMDGIHGITWSAEPLDCTGIIASYDASAAWTCEFGAKPVDVRPIDDTEGDLRYLAYYMLKPPYDVKMVEQRTTGVRLKPTEKGYKPEFAMRMLEGLSQLEMSMIVRSTYDGAKLRANWERRLTYWHKSRPEWSKEKLPQVDMDEFWCRIRSKKRKVEYAPYRFNR